MGPHFRGHNGRKSAVDCGVERSDPGAIESPIPNGKRRSSAALQNVAAIPWSDFVLAFWSAKVLCRFQTVRLALGM
jgi:hypothetical protein